jgi:hypothetical protein
MPSSLGPNTVNDSIVFNYDVGDIINSYTGRPTTNISAGIGMNVYNNVPGNVSSTLTGTGTYYRGAEIIKQTLTALDGSGASWLSGGNNPGIGVYTGGGGGTGGRYTGHSIFFKPTFPVTSCPVYTNYSNIGGWQSSCEYDNMGDGWFRARVLWYGGSTQSDGKYWAINPVSTSSGQTITLYWAGPFKEDLNVTNVSQYINGTRSSTQGLLDLSGRGNSISLSNVSFDSSVFPQMIFDGTNDYISPGSFNLLAMGNSTLEAVIYMNNLSSPDSSYSIFGGISDEGYHGYHEIRNSGSGYKMTYWTSANGWRYANTALSAGRWYHIVWVWNNTTLTWYLNGVNDGSYTFSTFSPYGLGMNRISSFPNERYMNGKINLAKIYNRSLSSTEIANNYNQYKTRFNLS